MDKALSVMRVVKVKATVSSGTSTITTDVVDLANAEGVVFLASIGTANVGNGIKLQQGAASNLSDAADLEGTLLSSDGTQTDFAVELYRPRERYVRAAIVRGAATTIESAWAVVYGPRVMPVTNATTAQAVEMHYSPAEGTA